MTHRSAAARRALAAITLAGAIAGCGSTQVVTNTNGTDTDAGTTPATTARTAPVTISTPTATTTTATTSTTTPTSKTTTGTSTATTGTSTATSTSTSTGTTPSKTTTTSASSTPTSASCGGIYEDVSGLSCSAALPVMNAWNSSSACEISDQGGASTTSSCTVDGYACGAKLGYPPGGDQQGEMSAIVTCEGKTTLSFIRGI